MPADPPAEETAILVPLDAIEPDYLRLRDRLAEDVPALEELANSLLRTGLRTPVEIWRLSEPHPPREYGLVSGFRRLAAFKLLAERSGLEKWSRIPAFLRAPGTEDELLRRIVEENDVRRDVSPWEKSRVAVAAAERGMFSSVEEAVDALYGSASPTKRSRIRAVCRAVLLLDGLLKEPWRLSQGQALRLATAAERENFGEAMQVALEESSAATFDSQWPLLLPLIEESEARKEANTPVFREGRPRRVLRARPTLTIRRERTPDGYTLHFTGKLAREGWVEDLLDDIERRYAPASERPRQ